MKNTRFESIGAYLPAEAVATRDLIRQMKFQPEFDLEKITGIESRRVHSKQKGAFEDSFALACLAARDCLSRSRYPAGELDVVICPSISRMKDGYVGYFEPSFGLMIARALGANRAIHFDLSNACAGMFTGVYLLDRLIKAGAVKNGMVVSGECITVIADTAVKEIAETFDPQFGSLTVGDSGAAVILDGSEDDKDIIHYIELMTCADYSGLCIGMPSDKTSGSALYTNNHEMHKEERIRLWPHFIRNFLKSRGSTFEQEQYDYIVQHQVGMNAVKRFNQCGADVLNTPMPKTLTVVEKYGNTATTSHFLVLHDHLKNKKLEKGSKILMVPAASGVITGCLSTTVSSLEV